MEMAYIQTFRIDFGKTILNPISLSTKHHADALFQVFHYFAFDLKFYLQVEP